MESPDTITAVELRGSDHTTYGEVAVRSVPSAAVAISIGMYPKGYPALDPNEDGALAASDGTTTLLAVVDGHDGFDAAAATLTAVCEGMASVFAADSPTAALRVLAGSAVEAITAALVGATAERRASRTTLALALVASSTATLLGVGDSRLIVIRRRRVQTVGSAPFFLGPGTDATALPVSRVRLKDDDRVLVGTDGLFDFLGADWEATVLAAADRSDPATAVRSLIDAAFAGGAGDNIAVAVGGPLR